MDFVGIIVATLAFLIGFALGCVAYRYFLKRNPDQLEELALAIKHAGESAGRRFE